MEKSRAERLPKILRQQAAAVKSRNKNLLDRPREETDPGQYLVKAQVQAYCDALEHAAQQAEEAVWLDRMEPSLDQQQQAELERKVFWPDYFYFS